MASATTTLLCALRFWGTHPDKTIYDARTYTLRRGVRHVARKQGFTPTELDRAERALIRRGLMTKTGERYGHSAVKLTERGWKLSGRACPRVPLAPWDHTKSFDGARRKRKRRRR